MLLVLLCGLVDCCVCAQGYDLVAGLFVLFAGAGVAW